MIPVHARGLENIALRGNIIDKQWRFHITKPCKKVKTMPDELAINILSEIVYVYTPYIIKDSHGATLKVIKRFRGDYWNQSMQQFMDTFMRSEDAIRAALKNLEKLGLIKREIIQFYKTPDGKVFRNIQNISPVTEAIAQISTQVKVVYSETDIKELDGDFTPVNHDHKIFTPVIHDHKQGFTPVNHDHIVTSSNEDKVTPPFVGKEKIKKDFFSLGFATACSEKASLTKKVGILPFLANPSNYNIGRTTSMNIEESTIMELTKVMLGVYKSDEQFIKELNAITTGNHKEYLVIWAGNFLQNLKKNNYKIIELHNKFLDALSWVMKNDIPKESGSLLSKLKATKPKI